MFISGGRVDHSALLHLGWRWMLAIQLCSLLIKTEALSPVNQLCISIYPHLGPLVCVCFVFPGDIVLDGAQYMLMFCCLVC